MDTGIEKKVFFIESEEKFALCPNCGDHLIYHCRVLRGLTDTDGKKSIYSIRVLKCDNKSCPTKYHRELPDIIIPYKRYDSDSIEEAITMRNTDITVAADQSTICRWRKWFKVNAIYIIMALLSVVAIIENDVETSSLAILNQKSNKPIEIIKELLVCRGKWLNKVVYMLVNSSKWIF